MWWPVGILILLFLGMRAVAQERLPTVWQPSILLQTRVLMPDSEALGQGNVNTVEVRRANVTVKGMVDPHILALVTVNFSTDPFLNEAYAEYANKPWTARLGLVRLPFGYEMPLSSVSIIPLERSQAITTLFSSKRDYDRGAFVYYTGRQLDVAAAVTNGTNAVTTTDGNDGKAVVGRVGWRVKRNAIGASYYDGVSSGNGQRMTRLGADLQLAQGPFLLLVEAITGKNGATSVAGGYGMIIYQRKGSEWQYFGRCELYDPNRDADYDGSRRVAVGMNRYLIPTVKLTAEYDFIRDPKNPGAGWAVRFPVPDTDEMSVARSRHAGEHDTTANDA